MSLIDFGGDHAQKCSILGIFVDYGEHCRLVPITLQSNDIPIDAITK